MYPSANCYTICGEILYLLSCCLEHSVGEQSVTLDLGGTLVVPCGVLHSARNIWDVDADMLLV